MILFNEDDGESWKKIALNKQDFSTYDIIVSDLNGDGRPEILECNSDEVNFFYRSVYDNKSD